MADSLPYFVPRWHEGFVAWQFGLSPEQKSTLAPISPRQTIPKSRQSYLQNCLLGGFDLWQGSEAVSDRLRNRRAGHEHAHGKSDGRTPRGCVLAILTASGPTLPKTGRKRPYFNGTLAILADKVRFLQICFSAKDVLGATKRFSAGNSTVASGVLRAFAAATSRGKELGGCRGKELGV